MEVRFARSVGRCGAHASDPLSINRCRRDRHTCGGIRDSVTVCTRDAQMSGAVLGHDSRRAVGNLVGGERGGIHRETA